MKAQITAIAALATLCLPGIAAAEPFTYLSQADAPSMLITMIGADGKPAGASAFSGAGETTYASGRKAKYTFKCISMSQPPQDRIFMSHMVCDVMAPDGNFSAVFGCNIVGEQDNSCVGGVYGKTGAYVGKRGTVTSLSKGVKSTGTGQWND